MNSSDHSIRQDSIHHQSMNCQLEMCVQIPKFPNLSPTSSIQDLSVPFSMFCLCVSLWQLGSNFQFLWIFFWIFPCSLRSYLCPHSWTMTCSVCPCQTIACLCSCVHCSLVEHASPHLILTHHADSMTLFLCHTRERVDRINIHGIRVSTQSRVTRLGITNC